MNTAVTASKRIYRSEPIDYASGSTHLGSVWKIILPCLAVLATGIAYIWLQSSTEQLLRKNSGLREQQNNQLRQLSNLRIDRETYTSRREILKRVSEFGLDLRPPTVGQTRRIALRQQPTPRNERSFELLAQSHNR